MLSVHLVYDISKIVNSKYSNPRITLLCLWVTVIRIIYLCNIACNIECNIAYNIACNIHVILHVILYLCGSVAKASDTQAVGHEFDPRPDP